MKFSFEARIGKYFVLLCSTTTKVKNSYLIFPHSTHHGFGKSFSSGSILLQFRKIFAFAKQNIIDNERKLESNEI